MPARLSSPLLAYLIVCSKQQILRTASQPALIPVYSDWSLKPRHTVHSAKSWGRNSQPDAVSGRHKPILRVASCLLVSFCKFSVCGEARVERNLLASPQKKLIFSHCVWCVSLRLVATVWPPQTFRYLHGTFASMDGCRVLGVPLPRALAECLLFFFFYFRGRRGFPYY